MHGLQLAAARARSLKDSRAGCRGRGWLLRLKLRFRSGRFRRQLRCGHVTRTELARGCCALYRGPARRLPAPFTLAGPRSRVDETWMLRMRQPMLETVIEVSEQLDGDATPLRAALALLKPEKAREKLR